MNFTGRKVDSPSSRSVQFPSVEKFMATGETTLSPEMTINEAIDIMLDQHLTGAPVLDNNRKIVGMLTEKDCLRLLIDSAYNNLHHDDKTVADYMSEVVKTVTPRPRYLRCGQRVFKLTLPKVPRGAQRQTRGASQSARHPESRTRNQEHDLVKPLGLVSTRALRVQSTAWYRSCGLLARVEATTSKKNMVKHTHPAGA